VVVVVVVMVVVVAAAAVVMVVVVGPHAPPNASQLRSSRTRLSCFTVMELLATAVTCAGVSHFICKLRLRRENEEPVRRETETYSNKRRGLNASSSWARQYSSTNKDVQTKDHRHARQSEQEASKKVNKKASDRTRQLGRLGERTSERTNGRTNGRTNERTNERTSEE
jgi:hypothetical protein